MLQLDGKTLPLGKAFVHDGIQYPSNWLALTSLEEKEAIGISEVAEPVAEYYDSRFYLGVDSPKDLDELKAVWTAKVKESASVMLKDTDWYVIRQAENSAAVPSDVLTRRGQIRTMSGEKETAIADCTDVAALATYCVSEAFCSWEPPAPAPTPAPTPSPTPSEE